MMDYEQKTKGEKANPETELVVESGGKENNENKTTTGLDENIGGLLCYVVGAITGIIFIIMEKENRFIRFHALQSIFTFVAILVLSLVFAAIPFIGWILGLLMTPISLVLWVFLMWKAYQGHLYKLPYIGNIVEKQLDKI